MTGGFRIYLAAVTRSLLQCFLKPLFKNRLTRKFSRDGVHKHMVHYFP